MFLEEVLRYVNNRFEMEEVHGAFSVSGGSLDVPDALEGQYYWVEGSVLNDGLHLHPDTAMRDEDFTGRVVLLAVPRALADLADEIEEWNSEHASEIDGPYQSESFGGYSYTKSDALRDGQESADGAKTAWQAKFGPRLRTFRKLSRDWV